MENLLESNERTLVMFDSVCSGLRSCLALVHADIRQMTEHRNSLAQLEQEQIQAKLVPAQELIVVTNNNQAQQQPHKDKATAKKKKKSVISENDDDPHHLAGLKMLDKRLADSFSRAFSMSDLQKSSLRAKHQAGQNKPSIFQVLLGKTNNKSVAGKQDQKAKTVSGNEPVDNKIIIDDINRQTRLAMQYSKQLEAHLFKVEDLRSKYEMHLKMGLVVKSVSRAYLASGSSPGTLPRHASKTTIKEFIENIDKVESEFEPYMGSFLLAIEDIQGFARVCQGDVFEISIKYGDSQKFKTKISVLKDNRQKCDNQQTVFKARIADVLAIKAYECKGLGKRVLLGHKLCETRDLFTARSQLMTISLNQTGSIKLNLIITWNPLHMAPNSLASTPGLDISHISLPPTPVSSSTLSSLSSVPSLNGTTTTTTINIQSQKRNRLDNSPSTMEYQCQQRRFESMYQTVDPTYGYYIPPPDYIIDEMKY